MFKFLFNRVPSISTNQLQKQLSNDIKILDVRSPSEFRGGHIRQAKNVPLNTIKNHQEKDREIYVICQSGVRSKKAAKILKQKGYNVINIHGGMNQWDGQIRGGK